MPIIPGKPARAKLIAAVMAPNKGLIEKAISTLEPAFGTVERSSPVFSFTHSDYYRNEMGVGLVKVFCSFGKLIDPDELVTFKLDAIEREKSFSSYTAGENLPECADEGPSQQPQQTCDSKPLTPREDARQGSGAPRQTTPKRSLNRRVNIDPGYLDRTKLVLATTKDCSHRVYLGRGIYGDVELIHKAGSFACLEWTYPDYRETSAIDFFNGVRSAYLVELREASR